MSRLEAQPAVRELFDWPPLPPASDSKELATNRINRFDCSQVTSLSKPFLDGGYGDLQIGKLPLSEKFSLDVVVKRFIPPAVESAKDDGIALGEFQFELLNRLIGPGTPTPLGYGKGDSADSHYLLYQKTPGEDLQSLFVKDTKELWKLTAQEFLKLARACSQTIERIHSLGIAHRDLKPANLILTPFNTVEVVDFDSAFVMPDTLIDRDWPLSARGLAIHAGRVSAYYAAPESWFSSGSPILWDIYSLGVTFYEIICPGQSLFPGRPNADLLARKQTFSDSVVDNAIKNICTDFPIAFAEFLIKKMLNPVPSKRPQQMREVIDVLDSVII